MQKQKDTIRQRKTPEEVELEKKQTELAGLEVELAERELELATFREELNRFEVRYFQEVGLLYAVLDELEAQIAERVAARHPRNERVRDTAERARAKARESAADASATEEAVAEAGDFRPSEELKAVFRDAAKRLHPDLATDDEDRERRTKAMAAANDAFAAGDEERLRAILGEWDASPDTVKGEGTGAELIRVIRQIFLIRQRLKRIVEELRELQVLPLAGLKRSVDEGLTRGRDVLKEMAADVQAEIDDAKERLATL